MPIFMDGTADTHLRRQRYQGHISTRQILRLLDGVAERVVLQETRPGRVRQRKRITSHLLRHSFSRWSLDAGIDISYLQHQLGHSSLTTIAIYLQARPNHRRKAYDGAGFDKLPDPHRFSKYIASTIFRRFFIL
jgi:site-specific recombinase XerD